MTAHLTARNCICILHKGQVLAYAGLGDADPQKAVAAATGALTGVQIKGDDSGAWCARRRVAAYALEQATKQPKGNRND
jgi:hypothetical protein